MLAAARIGPGEHLRKEQRLREDQTVSELMEEVLVRQANALVERTGQAFESALEAVASTEAGRHLRKLASGEHGHEKVEDWQANVLRERTEERRMRLIVSDALPGFAAERHYSWVEGYMAWLEGQEQRTEYHALLEEELASLRG